MDFLSIAGFILAFVSLIVGAELKGAGAQALLSSAAFTIVIVGTIAAICVQTPVAVMLRAFKIVIWAFVPPDNQQRALIKKLSEWGMIARKQGLLGLEALISKEQDLFLRRGMQLVVDGTEPEEIRSILEVEVSERELADMRAAKVYEGLGIYAPTLGIIGAVLGLMAVMKNLADPSKLGAGIAAAFTATIYGIGLANLFFLPLANKLKLAIQKQTQARTMIVEGLVSIAQGENPRIIEMKLQGYLH